jgi:hypothetical protein
VAQFLPHGRNGAGADRLEIRPPVVVRSGLATIDRRAGETR